MGKKYQKRDEEKYLPLDVQFEGGILKIYTPVAVEGKKLYTGCQNKHGNFVTTFISSSINV